MSTKGSKEERDVVKLFEGYGYGAIRVPASGGRTSSDKPDVIAGNHKHYFAIEVKSSKNDYIYIRDEQMDELTRFSAKFGATPLVCVKFTRKPFTLFNPYNIRKTSSGVYSVKRDELSNGIVLDDFIKKLDDE